MKTYTFTQSKGKGTEKTYTLKESELKQREKDLLLGELIRQWEDSPVDTQIRFMKMMCDAVKGKNEERFKNVIKPIVDAIIKDLIP